jgi:hypothetical protein
MVSAWFAERVSRCFVIPPPAPQPVQSSLGCLEYVPRSLSFVHSASGCGDLQLFVWNIVCCMPQVSIDLAPPLLLPNVWPLDC